MSALKSQLDPIDLSTNSRNILAVLIQLLTPHIPYSLHILGTILNSAPRASALQSVDPSKVVLWSTIPLQPSDAVSTTDSPALFSIVTFSHLDHRFRFFCSGESSTNLPTEAEQAHVKQVFEHLRDITSEARPTYDSILTAPPGGSPRHRVDTDPPMIEIWALHSKWMDALAPMSTFEHSGVRYVIPPALKHEGPPVPSLAVSHPTAAPRLLVRARGGDTDDLEVEVSQIRPSDLPFVYGASTVPRPEAYIMSRAPYSVCLRLSHRGKTMTEVGADEGQPVACALLHSDGSIGALRVDTRYQRRGLGKLVVGALIEKLNFNQGQGDLDLIPDGYRDLGGGALGWNWMDTEVHNGAGNGFFTSLSGGDRKWTSHWTFMFAGPNENL